MKRLPVLLLTLISLSPAAQDARPVVAILPFITEDVGESEKKTIERLVNSYVSELEDFKVVTQTSGDINPTSADYRLSGNIDSAGEDRVLTIEVLKVKTGEKKSVSSIHRSLSDLALSVHTLVMRVFERQDSEENARNENRWAFVVREDDVIGAWRGDKGIEIVRVFRGGKAVAVLSSNAQMELSYRLEGPVIGFKQTSRNTVRFYHPVPYAVALELVKIAEPMEWTFRLTEDGSALKGTKNATAVSYEGNTIKTVFHDAKRDAEWIRGGR